MARPASDISSRILHAAREQFLSQGVDGASLREIAKSAGTNIGMVYYYFETKDALFLGVVEEVYVGLLEGIREALSGDVAPEARVLRLYTRIGAMSDTEFQIMRLIMREALVSSTRLQKLVQRFQAGHLPLLAALFRDGLASHSFRNDTHPLGLMAATVSLGIMPQVVRRLLTTSELPIAQALPSALEAATTLHELLLHGIACAEPEAKLVPARKRPTKRGKVSTR